jgi:hypothetical protein
MTEKTYTLTARQLDMVIQCLARAEAEGAFKDCVVPRIGRSTLAMLEGLRAETQEEWAGSPCPDDPDNFWICDKTGVRIPA